MNIAEETNQILNINTSNLFSYPSNPNNSNTLPWTQGPPQYIPWGHSPNSPPASLVTFSAQPGSGEHLSAQMNEMGPSSSQNQMCFGQNIINNVNNQSMGTTSNFGHNIQYSNNQPVASTSSYGNKPMLHCKRKANLDFPLPTKQHITEEKMAQHMSRLHISSESHPETLSQNDLEDSSARQKRLYVCEEMRRLQTESILPTALLGRLERPCMAVMLWQPPSKIPELIGSSQNLTNSAISTAMVQAGNLFQRPGPSLEEDENDNSSGTMNLNNMDMDS